MELTLFNHENIIGDEISKSLRSGKYSDFRVAVAYARNSGVGRIYDDLAHFSGKGGKTSAIIGIDQTNTSYQALINLKTFTKDNLYIHHDKNFAITFHPKIYLFGNTDIEKVIIGSSNFTAGGFYSNYEANVDIALDGSKDAKNFQKQIYDFWKNLIMDENTKKCSLPLLDKLLESGLVVDERKQKAFKEIIEKILPDIPFKEKKKLKTLPPIHSAAKVTSPSIKDKFAMTLSAFDVSSRSLDPVILIPIAALKVMPIFWNFPILYTNSSADYPQLYATANIHIDGKALKDQHLRIYYYDRKKEFRLQCEAIKRNGKPGDIILIGKDYNNPLEFNIELLRTGTLQYKTIAKLLRYKVSSQKFFNYI